MEAAQATARARVHGEVRHSELEFEHHRWIYSVEPRRRPGHRGGGRGHGRDRQRRARAKL